MATAKGQRQAAAYNAGLYDTNQTTTMGYLQGNADKGLGAIQSGQNSAVQSLYENKDNALDALGYGYSQGRGDINSGFGQARQDTQAGIDLFNPYVQNGQAANNAQSDFLGLNGAGASGAQQTALNNFRNGTGYRDIVDQTSDAALRRASVVGGLGGNQLDELGRIGGQLANQSSQQYFGNLGSLGQIGLQAAGQQQQGYGQLASQGMQQGGALAGLATGQADREAGIYTNLGNSLGNAFQNAGQQQAGIYTGLGNSLNQLGQFTVGGIAKGVSEQGAASDAAKSANQQTMVNAATTGLSLLAGGMGGGMGGLGGLFGGSGAVSNGLGAMTGFSPFASNM